MGTSPKKEKFYSLSIFQPYKTSTFWNRIVIVVPKENYKDIKCPTHPGEWLMYYRKKYNLTREEVESETGILRISAIERKKYYPSREVSEKLARYFQLDTKYFHDERLENGQVYKRKRVREIRTLTLITYT